jgi:hypothetical protein
MYIKLNEKWLIFQKVYLQSSYKHFINNGHEPSFFGWTLLKCILNHFTKIKIKPVLPAYIFNIQFVKKTSILFLW